jgi:hypothetical protein
LPALSASLLNAKYVEGDAVVSKSGDAPKSWITRWNGWFCGFVVVAITAVFAQGAAAQSQRDTIVVTVAGQKVKLGTAAGYCINEKQSRFSASGASILMASCKPDSKTSTAKGLVLVNVLADKGIKEAVQGHDLEEYFQSSAGRAALSRKGNADQVNVLGTMEENGIYYVHSKDSGGPLIPDTTDEQWRVFFVVAERLISVSIINFVDSRMPDGIVFAQLDEIAQRIKTLN